MAEQNHARNRVPQEPIPIAPKARVAFEQSVPVHVHLAILWMIFGLLELGLSALIPDTALRDVRFPFGARLSLVAYNLAVLLAFVCAIAGPLMFLARLGRPGVRPVIRWMIGGFRTFVVWVAVFLYGASWTAYWNIGVFLDREAFAFWAPHPVQVFHWVYPPLAIGVIVATLILAVALSQWVPRWVATRRPSVRRHLVLAAGGAVGVCAIAALLGGLAYGRTGTEPGHAKSPYAVARDDRSGPVVHALADLRRLWNPDELSPV
ncbi:MAG: Sulfatase protein, partial [candidate division NC10 bacterium]|nr:Sulfatase protein [candidate division NC10 bacterium]